MSSKAIQIVALLTTVGLIYGASRFAPKINEGRVKMDAYAPQANLENIPNVPPEYAFLIQAFGAFRSLITDIVFIQAEEYKSQGRYYDAMQLHKWICQLQPRFPSVWEYCSWNMAWNISVMTYTPEERWNWIYNGAKLVRDDGLRYNPRAVNLYKQLAWIYNNKMGETVDEFHMTYKRNWAWRMHLLLGPPPDPLGEFDPEKDLEFVDLAKEDDPFLRATQTIRDLRRQAGIVTDEEIERSRADGAAEETPDAKKELTEYEVIKRTAYDRIAAIRDTPDKLKGLYAEYPETEEMVAQLAALGIHITDKTLHEDRYWVAGGLGDTFFRRYRRLADPPSLLIRILKETPDDPDAGPIAQMGEILGIADENPAGQALVRFVQRKVLNEVYKLDPHHMAFLVQRFGPIDWRAVDSQSLYWVSMGIIKGGETMDTFVNDKTNTMRIIFFSLRNLYLRNKITFEPYPPQIDLSYINLAPDIHFLDSLHETYLTYGQLVDPDPGNPNTAGDTFSVGHINFLSEGIRLLYFSDEVEKAQFYYDYLRTHYGRHENGTPRERYLVPLEDFVMTGFAENMDTNREVTNAINALLEVAFGNLADMNISRYNNLVRRARKLHEDYMEDKDNMQRLKLPAFFDIHVDLLANWLRVPTISHLMTLEKVRLWQVLPVNLRQHVFDDLIEGLTAECDAFGFDVAKAFLEPPGMQQFRELRKGRGEEKKKKDIETPAQPLGG